MAAAPRARSPLKALILMPAAALAAAVAAPTASAQALPADLVSRFVAAQRAVALVGVQRGGAVWPGFRPDATPVLYVVPERGSALVNWPAALPDGFVPLSGVERAGTLGDAVRGAASTSVILNERPTAQVSADGSESLLDLIALTAHEAFHVFEGGVRRDGLRFAAGENSFLVTQYPVFDPHNEAAMALEGRLLAAALGAASDSAARALARLFLAERYARHRRLEPEIAEFETLAELHEGMAEYAGYRVSQLATGTDRTPEIVGRLETLTEDVVRSIRLRYYVTGPGLGYLLDLVGGTDWKARLVEENWTLHDALAHAVGYLDAETALREEAARRFGGDALAAGARIAVDRLRAQRRAQVDSLLRNAGLIVEIAAERLPRVGLCGIDPQNVLQVEPGVFLHTRWVQPCAGSAFRAEFNAPVVEERDPPTLRAAVSDTTPPTVSAGGSPLTIVEGQGVDGVRDLVIEHPEFTVRTARADIRMEGRRILVRPYPD